MEQANRKLQSEYLSRTMTTDLATEFVLPDYQPEIKRLLRVRAIPLPPDQYLGGSTAEFSGTVEFQVLYAAEDSSLWCVTRREDYRLSCPFDVNDEFDLSEGFVCDVKTDVEGVSGRVLAPRSNCTPTVRFPPICPRMPKAFWTFSPPRASGWAKARPLP